MSTSHLTTTSFQLTEAGIRGNLIRTLNQASAVELDPIANILKSSLLSEKHVFTGEIGGLKIWNGPRQSKRIEGDTLTIENLLYEDTLLVTADQIKYDQTGQVQLRINEIAQNALTHRRDLMAALIAQLGTTLSYDGQYFFDTDHVFGKSGTVSNLITFDISDDAAAIPSDERGTAAKPSAQTLGYAVLAGIQAMIGFKGNDGEKLVNRNMREVTVAVPLHYMTAMSLALGLNVMPNRADNVLLGGLEQFRINMVWVPELTGNSFDIYRTDASFKSIIVQETDEYEIDTWGMDSEFYKENYAMKYGIHLRRGIGPGEPRSAVRVALQA